MPEDGSLEEIVVDPEHPIWEVPEQPDEEIQHDSSTEHEPPAADPDAPITVGGWPGPKRYTAYGEDPSGEWIESKMNLDLGEWA
ncbi:hypothetical protein G3I44_10925 [Halogeometricum borinquense]|uniref:Uncharacterized protein n=1 Tax=Halogeometricum borinquense TaxID=60847 RepID=A0A6C0UJI3_9EURY|nr:hypothetical protein [Halogeometricum borinquense]QIB74753.1 hypothetical protein G3I44_10925 [Halogeometricum borinquense]